MWKDQPHSREEQVFCTPGQPTRPDSCTEHREHRWCPVCEGWFVATHVLHSARIPVALLGHVA